MGEIADNAIDVERQRALRVALAALGDAYMNRDATGRTPSACQICGDIDNEHEKGCLVGRLAELLEDYE